MTTAEYCAFATIVLAIFSVVGQLVIVNNKLDALIKAVREQGKDAPPIVSATGKPITEHEMEEKQ